MAEGVNSTSWYKAGQTADSVLGEVSSSMEECRAETVALYCKSFCTALPCEHSILNNRCLPVVASEPRILEIFKVRSCAKIPAFVLNNRSGHSTPTRRTLKTYSTSPSCSWPVPVSRRSSTTIPSRRSTVRRTCRLGQSYLNHLCDSATQTHESIRLGITQHLIKAGIARLEEVRGADGSLEDVYVRVRAYHP